MKKLYNPFLFRIIPIVILTILTAYGSNCDTSSSNGGNTVPQEILGNWKLIEQTGALQDICPNETVLFESSGNATLTCPNSNSITRTFTVSNNVLTYTQSGVSYGLQILNSGNLYLTGQNVSRNLEYQKITDSVINISPDSKPGSNNSSEGGLVK